MPRLKPWTVTTATLCSALCLATGCATAPRPLTAADLPILMDHEFVFLPAATNFVPATRGVFLRDRAFEHLLRRKISDYPR